MTVAKLIELIGSSPNGGREAAQDTVNESAMTVKNIKEAHVKRCLPEEKITRLWNTIQI